MTKTLKAHFINVSPNSSLVCLHSLYLDILSYIVQVLSIILVFPLGSPNGPCLSDGGGSTMPGYSGELEY
jgi:hypothetical protein